MYWRADVRHMLMMRKEGDVESFKGTITVYRYGYVNVPPFVIPIEGHVEVEGTGAVNGGGLIGTEGVVEVVDTGARSGVEAKVFDHEGKSGGDRRGQRYLFSSTRTVNGRQLPIG